MNIATWSRPSDRSPGSWNRSTTKRDCTRLWATARPPSLNDRFRNPSFPNYSKKVTALAMRFFRHDGIYRSDVSSLLVNPVQLPPPVGRPRYPAIGRAGTNHTSCPSSAMSSPRLFLDRGGRHQSPSPLHRHCQKIKPLLRSVKSEYHRTVDCVLTVCVSRGDKRKVA